jgi:amino acid transporter
MQGYICLIGLLMSLFSFCGYEAGAHMAEETRDARKAAPKGIIHSVIAGIVIGFVYLICLLFR